MPLEDPAPDEVIALQFDELAVASELAKWCGGVVVQSDDQPPAISVPTPKGPVIAVCDEWIVKYSDGTHTVPGDEDFVARHRPQPPQ